MTGLGYVVIEVNRARSVSPLSQGEERPPPMPRWPRAALSGVAYATPKSGKGEVEMIRMLKSTKRCHRTQTVNQMKALVLTAPAELREMLDGLTTRKRRKLPYLSFGTIPRRAASPPLPRLPLPSAQ